MKYREYTDDEIVLLVEAYTKRKCDNCRFADIGVPCGSCFIRAIKESINIINRQKAEIERLQSQLDCYEETSGNKQAKAEAIKEFAERLHNGINDFRDKREMVMLPYTEAALLCIERKIDDLVKEMTGGEHG